MCLPVGVILLIVCLEPLDQLGVDSEGVLAVGEGVPHLKVYLLGLQLKGDKMVRNHESIGVKFEG